MTVYYRRSLHYFHIHSLFLLLTSRIECWMAVLSHDLYFFITLCFFFLVGNVDEAVHAGEPQAAQLVNAGGMLLSLFTVDLRP